MDWKTASSYIYVHDSNKGVQCDYIIKSYTLYMDILV